MKNPSFQSSRRNFLKVGSCAFISTGLYGQQVLSANNRLRIGVLGCGIRGRELIRYFDAMPDVDLVAISDADTARMDWMIARLKKIGSSAKVETYQDYRKIYDRKDIDAVAIATPNYWHALQTVQALEAGKHVYLEKPISFTPWEGIQLEAAERKHDKVIAVGYQNRSSTGPLAGIGYLQEGLLGKPQKVHVVCYRNRDSIGKLEQPLQSPKTVNHDLWLGPAEEHSIMRPKYHYDWHWDFRTGNGDMANVAVHDIDLACWLLGEPELPTRIQTFGNRFAWDDAGNTPNMFTSYFKMGGADVIVEVNNMKLSPERNVAPHRMGTRIGIIAECEKGILKGGRFGMLALEPDGKTIIKKFPGDGGGSHPRNFIDAIRASDPSLLRSRIETANRSANLAHFSNISYRLGELASSKELSDSLSSNNDLSEIIESQGKQLFDWGQAEPKYFVGQTIQIDPKRSVIESPNVGTNLIGPKYRKGYELKPQT